MRIPFSLAIGMQRRLQYLAEYSSYAEEFTSNLGAKDRNEAWQIAVDTIYRFFICGLIYSPSVKEKMRHEDWVSMYSSYVSSLANKSPFSYPLNAEWIEWDILGTDLCRNILIKNGVKKFNSSSPISEGLIDELEGIFDANMVGWSDVPLIKIAAMDDGGV